MAKQDALQDYHAKRDFRKTSEPQGESSRDGQAPIFVIQKHAASQLHYDFRLEADGILKSWSVPKGPSTDPREKRLAVRTEDHPREYSEFEGVIPEDEYGGGTVLIWDRGPYRNLKEDVGVAEGVDQGHITVWLEGKKLRGGYALTRFREERGRENWLLVKMDDDQADARRNPVSTEPDSVASGRSLEEVARQEGD